MEGWEFGLEEGGHLSKMKERSKVNKESNKFKLVSSSRVRGAQCE